MNHPEKQISRERINHDLRSPFLILAAISCLGAAVFAIPGIRQLFNLETTNEFLLHLSLQNLILLVLMLSKTVL